MFRFIKYTSLVLIVLYVIGCAILYTQQDRIIFNPTPLDDHVSYRWGEEVYIDVDDHVRLHGLYKESPSSKGAILYLHGNRGNTKWCQRQASVFDSYGMDVLLIDYRGYGKSDGEIESMEQLEKDMDKVYNWLSQQHPQKPIWVAGYSLGSGLASYLAAKHQAASLLLIAPYSSIEDMKDQAAPFIPDFLLKFPLSNAEHLPNYDGDIAIFHGTEDEVIPYHHAEDLNAMAPDQIKLHTLEGTGHRRAIFHTSIDAYLSAKLTK